MANDLANEIVDTPAATSPRDLPDNYLALYFKDAANIPVLRPNEEIDLAQRIEDLENEMWCAILDHPGLIEPLLGFIEPLRETRLKGSKQLRMASRALRTRNTAASRRRYEELVSPVARQIREEDLDREILALVQEKLQDVAGGHLRRLGGQEVRVTPDSKSFTEYHQQVLRLCHRSQKVRNYFINANLRLVMSIVRRYNNGQMPLHDLIQEGNMGLIKAVGRFDHRRGFRFSTYASWWIRHSINRALADKGRLVRVPVHLLDNYQKMSAATWQLNSQLGRLPTSDELSSTTGLGKDKVERLQKTPPSAPFSLDNTLSSEDDRSYIDMLASEDDPSPSECVMNSQLSELILRALDGLPDMEADVLRRRFGLNDRNEQTLKEIGRDYGLSRERIRQIQEEALAKIRRALQRNRAL